MLVAETGDGSAAGRIQNPPAVLADQPDALAADRPGRRFTQASMQHPALADAHDGQSFSATYCDIAASRPSVSSRRRLAPAPPSTKVTAASDCAIAMAPVRLGKNPGDAAASNSSTWSAPSAIGAATVSAIAISAAPDRCAARADDTLGAE